MIQKEVQKENNRITVKDLCAIAGVSCSGYYRWIHSREARIKREEQDKKDFAQILKAYRYRGYNKGARSIHMRLLRTNVCMNLKKIRRLMKKFGLKCPIRRLNPYRQMARDMKTNAVADNHLKRQFREHGPRAVLLTDITYIRYNRTFCYLSTIKDAYTMEILSYVLSPSLELDFVLQTVQQLLQYHEDAFDAEVMIHSDQGCHYTSTRFRQLLADHNLRQSMSRRGNCWDNAPQESFFGHMKEELRPKMNIWYTFDQVKEDIDDWIDYYNNDRGQWALQKMAPAEFYRFCMFGIRPTWAL